MDSLATGIERSALKINSLTITKRAMSQGEYSDLYNTGLI